MTTLQKENETYFSTEMCSNIINNVAKFGIYGQSNDQSKVLRGLYQLVDEDEIDFIQNVSEKDLKNMDQLVWLK